MDNLPRQSRVATGFGRLLHRTHDLVRDSVRFCRAYARSPADRPFQRDRSSNCRVDRTANRRSFSLRLGAEISLARSRSDLRIRVPKTSRSDEHQGSAQRSEVSVARMKFLVRTITRVEIKSTAPALAG